MTYHFTGSDKQIAWANEIAAKIDLGLEWGIANAPDSYKAKMADICAKIANAPARKIIDAFADVTRRDFPTDGEQAFRRVIGAFNAHQKIASSEDKF